MTDDTTTTDKAAGHPNHPNRDASQLSFSDVESTEEDALVSQQQNEQFSPELYKKWYNAKGRKGFLSLDTWLDAGKASVDIGEIVDGAGGPRNTKVWTNVVALATYLAAVRDGRAGVLYPAKGKDRPTPETYVYYGGAMTDAGPVSRILKIHHWQDPQGNYDETSFVFKTGHFAARMSSSGAFLPDMSKPVSSNLIRMSRVEMAEMSYRLDLALNAFAATTGDWLAKLNGKAKR